MNGWQWLGIGIVAFSGICYLIKTAIAPTPQKTADQWATAISLLFVLALDGLLILCLVRA